MARIRTIKPEFWTSEQIAECSPNTRLMFIGMWNFCDDYGVIPASVKRLKMQLFPADESIGSDDIRRMIDELSKNDLLQEYDIDGKAYWYVTGWARNQNIESPTGRYPMPNGEVGKTIRGSRANTGEYRRSPQDQKALREQDSPNDLLTFGEVEPKGKGKGKGVEASKPQKSSTRGSRLKEDWKPSDELIEWAKRERPDLEIQKTVDVFVDYWVSASGSKGVKNDWDRTFKNWVRNQHQSNNKQTGRSIESGSSLSSLPGMIR